MNASAAIPQSVLRARRIGLPIVFVVALIGLAQLLSQLNPGASAVIPPPSAVLNTLVSSFSLLLEQAEHTAWEALIGFVLGAGAGVMIAVLMAMWPPLNKALYPNLVAFQLIPKIALAPLFSLWLGVGSPSRIVFTMFLCFFPTMVATTVGLASAPKYALDLSRALNASKLQTFFLVRAPFALPFVAAGLKVSATLAMIGIVVGEFVTAQTGLGYIVLFASSAGEPAVMFAALILLSVEGLVLYGAVTLLAAWLQRWYGAPFDAPEGL